MKKAERTDRELVVAILTTSFRDNKSVNSIILQDEKRMKRIKLLMEYAFDVCMLYGDVWLTEDNLACALLVKPDKKRTTLQSVLLDIRFATRCLGIANIRKAMSREAAISKVHPQGPLYYLWFIGVDPAHQHQGIGSELVIEVLEEATKQKRAVCLETSTLENIPWYQKLGFTIYHQLDFGYKLFCMKK